MPFLASCGEPPNAALLGNTTKHEYFLTPGLLNSHHIVCDINFRSSMYKAKCLPQKLEVFLSIL